MPARKSRSVSVHEDLSAVRPKSFEEDFVVSSTEEGLSIDPDELGTHYLRFATEQGGVVGSPEPGEEERGPLDEETSDSEEDDVGESDRDEKEQPREEELFQTDPHGGSLFDEEGEQDEDEEDEEDAESDARFAQRSSTL